MKDVISPIAKELLVEELSKDKFLRKTNYGNNEIFVITHHNAPNVMREIGRLREISFRQAGGGTGKDVDIDSYDTDTIPYSQLIVWDPKEQEIMGGYRFIDCSSVPQDKNGNIKLATTGLFDFSDKFINEYLPNSLELGRSFVTPKYQASNKNRKAVFALDNLWDGLGALVVEKPKIKYLTGKITMYTQFDNIARDMILHFFNMYFPDNDKLITAKHPLGISTDIKELKEIFTGKNYAENYKILSRKVRDRHEKIPPLFNSYMNISPSMKVFGTATNNNFGGVEETGIMVTLKDIYPMKKERYIKTYSPTGINL